MSCPRASSDPSPALNAFVARVFELARTFERLHHVQALRDEPLASVTNLLLRAQIRRVRHAYAMLDPNDRPEAAVLLSGLAQRAVVVIAEPPFANTLAVVRELVGCR